MVSDITRRHGLTADSLFLRLLQSFCHLFGKDSCALDVRVVSQPSGLGSTTSHFDRLWFSAAVSSCCKEKSPC